MKQPDEFIEPKTIDPVSKFKHALYGRKQSHHMLNQTIDDYIRKISDPSSARYCMSSVMAQLLIYVDNLILACIDMDLLAAEAAA